MATSRRTRASTRVGSCTASEVRTFIKLERRTFVKNLALEHHLCLQEKENRPLGASGGSRPIRIRSRLSCSASLRRNLLIFLCSYSRYKYGVAKFTGSTYLCRELHRLQCGLVLTRTWYRNRMLDIDRDGRVLPVKIQVFGPKLQIIVRFGWQ
jgi:hypothetical protein